LQNLLFAYTLPSHDRRGKGRPATIRQATVARWGMPPALPASLAAEAPINVLFCRNIDESG